MRENFILLISDAAPYMIKTFGLIKPFYPNINFIACVLHLLHNCAHRIRPYYKNMDQLISSVKLLTVKNSSKQEAFSDIGRPHVL